MKNAQWVNEQRAAATASPTARSLDPAINPVIARGTPVTIVVITTAPTSFHKMISRRANGCARGGGGVVDLGAEHAGTDDQRGEREHDGQAKRPDHRLRPIARLGAEAVGKD